ncbi:MafI family immunity protein [Herbaspirillum sp. GW103]|uniref:MafI family immunity protein n=1 Tax=Herbaspirillum sp. GW103 TaxID=1175306 RepID=UPI0005574B9B|nr:MafI family immunity protein [Herbaspirillum sp. GW103]
MFSEKIKDFACRISGKLEDELLEGALNYLDHNEEALAIEILCDHLIEYDVPLSQDDLSFLKSILIAMNFNILMPPFKYFDFS